MFLYLIFFSSQALQGEVGGGVDSIATVIVDIDVNVDTGAIVGLM